MEAGEYTWFEDDIIKIMLPSNLKKAKHSRFFSLGRGGSKKQIHSVENVAISIAKGPQHFELQRNNLSQGGEFIFENTNKRLIHRGPSFHPDMGYESFWATEDVSRNFTLTLRYDIVFFSYLHTFEIGVLGNAPEDKFVEICHRIVSSIDFPEVFKRGGRG